MAVDYKFLYISYKPYSRSYDNEKWNVKTEDIYINTQKRIPGLTTIHVTRCATSRPGPDKLTHCFKIKAWGRAGWNS